MFRRADRPARRWAPALLVAYLVLLALVAFWPTPVDRPLSAQLATVLAYLHAHGVPAWIGYAFVESGANVALFVPFGLLATALLPARRWWLGMVLGLAASCTIELGQLLFLDARFATLADVGANTLGAVLGAGCTVAFRAVADRLASRRT